MLCELVCFHFCRQVYCATKMKFVAALFTAATVSSLSISALAGEGCDYQLFGNNYTFAYLPAFGSYVVPTGTGSQDFLNISLSPCKSSVLDFNCGSGFAGVSKDKTKCGKAFSVESTMRVDVTRERYVEKVYLSSETGDNSSLTLRVSCDPSAGESSFFANSSIFSVFTNHTHEAYLINFFSNTVCPNYSPSSPETTPPPTSTASPEASCDFEDVNGTRTLKYVPTGNYSAPLSNGEHLNVSFSACQTSSDLGYGCGSGFVGITDGNDTCTASFKNVTLAVSGVDHIGRVYSSDDAVLSLRVYCAPELENGDLVSNSSRYARHSKGAIDEYEINFYSKTVCIGYRPSDEDDDEINGLKTGAIVGIVIGVVGVVVLGAVIYQWRAKAAEEARLQYTQLNN